MNARNICLTTDVEDNGMIAELAAEFSLHPKIVRLLAGRGIEGREKLNEFLNPSIDGFHDPALLSGMTDAKRRLERAFSQKERIVVFGDYDCDGICSTAILVEYFNSAGAEAYPFVPNRAEGYGLNIESIEKIAEEFEPDLIVTCDCGISAHEEVSYILDLGMDVIVTDHHEIPEKIPECTVINPKLAGQEYPYGQLCGAGVALKLVHMLGGAEEMKKYLDLAAIATVADLVPLTGENRLIVRLGIEELNKRARPGLKMLFENASIKGLVTSGDIAYKLSPRLNAAGRMGDAFRAFALLVSKDNDEIKSLIEEIESDNTRRKELCDNMFKEAEEDLKDEDMTDSRAIVLSNPAWEKGITGIIAARLTGEYKRPAFLLTDSGEVLKGTSRGIDGINIYDALCSMKDILTEFGGHSQAAGFSLLKDRLEEFKDRIKKIYGQADDMLFAPAIKYDCDISEDEITSGLVRSIERMEPFGNCNHRPVFRLKHGKMTASALRGGHIQLTSQGGNTILAFNQQQFCDILSSDVEKNLFIDADSNIFAGKKSIKLILKNFSCKVDRRVDNGRLLCEYLESMRAGLSGYAAEENPEEAVERAGIFGTLIIASGFDTYDKFIKRFPKAGGFCLDYLLASNKNNYSRILIGGNINFDLRFYSTVIFADRQPGNALYAYVGQNTSAKVYRSGDYAFSDEMRRINTGRDIFGSYYKLISKHSGIRADSFFELCKKLCRGAKDVSLAQTAVCVMVFEELGILQFTGNGFQYKINDVKRALGESAIYSFFAERRYDEQEEN